MSRLGAGRLLALALLLFGTSAAGAQDAPKTNGGKPVVRLTTSVGDIRIELDREKAPVSVENFLSYVEAGFYEGTVFHRVIPGFMVQGGGFTPDLQQKPTRAPIKNEAGNGLRNERGTLAMARTNVVDSATAQFFVNVVDNEFLNHTSPDPQGFGYAVFGRVIEGMDVVDQIVKKPTATRGVHQNVPVEPILIQRAAKE